jgi:RNA polymerase sigma-70 factor (ECF subfamily)
MSPSARKTSGQHPTLQLVRADGPSDGELLDGVRANDPTWAEAFCRRVWPTVLHTAQRLLGERDADVDDVAQLAVMAALESTRRFKGESTLDGWVRTVTANTVYKHLRRRGLERKLFAGLETAEPEASPAPGPRAVVGNREAVKRVLEHLKRIDEHRATAWVLHDVHGYDLKEIAAITQVSEAAAQTRLSRGRRELLERLKADPRLAELWSDLEGDAP